MLNPPLGFADDASFELALSDGGLSYNPKLGVTWSESGLMKLEESILDTKAGTISVLVLLMGGVVAAWWYLPPLMTGSLESWAEKGQLGDSFGAVNALFSGLAYAGLIFTILLQQREIKLQRLEFQAQIQEMQQSREELARQAEIQTKQLNQGEAQLRIRMIEMRFELLKLKSQQWVEHARYENMRAHFEGLASEMQSVIDDLASKQEGRDANA